MIVSFRNWPSHFIPHYFHFMEALVFTYCMWHENHSNKPIKAIFIGQKNWNNPNQANFQKNFLEILFPETEVVENLYQGEINEDVLVVDFEQEMAKTKINKFLEGISSWAWKWVPELRKNILDGMAKKEQFDFDGYRKQVRKNLKEGERRVLYLKRQPPRYLIPEIEEKLFRLIENYAKLNVIDFAGLSLVGQMSEVYATDIMIGVHGNGLTNCFWLPPSGVLMEIFPVGVHHYDYQMFSELLGIRYFGFEGDNIFRDHSRFGAAYGHEAGKPVEYLNFDNIDAILKRLTRRNIAAQGFLNFRSKGDGESVFILSQPPASHDRDRLLQADKSTAEKEAASSMSEIGERIRNEIREENVSMRDARSVEGDQNNSTGWKRKGVWSPPEEDFFAAIARFQESVSSAFQAGAKIAQREVERILDGIFDAYAKARGFELNVKFGFSDFDALGTIQPGLCIVQLAGRDAAISFPRREWSPSWMGIRLLAVIEALEAAVSAAQSASGTFFAALVDEGHEPALAFSTRHPQGCAIPDAHFFVHYGYLALRREIASRWIPWEEREQRIFWRGVTTGIRRYAPPPEGEPDDLRWLPRLELCLAARGSRHAALFDVGLSKIVQIDEPHLVRRIEEAGLLRPGVPHIEFMNYKARVVIDGNANAWDATFGSLLMGNCTFLVQSEHGWRQWYHDELRPWEHYIPVSADLSDLDERVDWYLAHQDEAKAIAARGKELADRLTFSNVYSNIADPIVAWLPVGSAQFRKRVEKQGFRVTEFRSASGVPPLRLRTHHGTVVFVQLATVAGVTSGTLRHGPEESSEKNIALIIKDGLAELVYIAPDGTYHGVSVAAQPLNQPVPPERRDGMPGPGRFEIVPIPGEPGGVALRRDGLYLCAEGDGRVTLSREQIGAWEIFRLQLLDPGALPAGAAQGAEGETSEAPQKTVRPLVIDRLWQGSDPFAGFPAERYEADTQGWGSQHRYLADAIDAFSPRVVVEIRVWKGASTMTMARRMKERGLDGVVIAVDTWLGSYEHWVSDEWRASLRFEHGYPALFQTFMANIVKSGLAEYVVPLPLDSMNAAQVLRHFGIRADVIHIDGGHDYETVSRDLQVWWELLKPGGVLIGDDYDRGGSWPGVRRAFDEFFNALGLFPFEHEGGKCRILKPA